jgi:hypothetical protein
VFVLDAEQQPLDPVPPGRARILLTQGKAAVFRRSPFTILLKAAVSSPRVQELRVKIDPGSKTTGLAMVNHVSGKVVWAAEITHRGDAIKRALVQRRAVRRNRRQRKTRYRKPRVANRKRRNGWLAPSLESRVANITTWVRRLKQLAPVTALSQELVKFDFQQMEHPEISGIEYQHGTLVGYERLQECGLPLECASGGLTKFNRLTRSPPKEHWIDAACVGKSTPAQLQLTQVVPLLITATGHGSRQKCNVNACGMVCSKPKGLKKVKGFQTGDIVRAVVPRGKNQGVYAGQVLVRASGSFDIRTKQARVQGISSRSCTLVHRCDGYRYGKGAGHSSPVSATRGLLAR